MTKLYESPNIFIRPFLLFKKKTTISIVVNDTITGTVYMTTCGIKNLLGTEYLVSVSVSLDHKPLPSKCVIVTCQ